VPPAAATAPDAAADTDDAAADTEAPTEAEPELDELHPVARTAATASVAPVNDARRKFAVGVMFVLPLSVKVRSPAHPVSVILW